MKKKTGTYPESNFEIQAKEKNLGDCDLFRDEKHETSHSPFGAGG